MQQELRREREADNRANDEELRKSLVQMTLDLKGRAPDAELKRQRERWAAQERAHAEEERAEREKLNEEQKVVMRAALKKMKKRLAQRRLMRERIKKRRKEKR